MSETIQKKILAVYYSQSGQLKNIVENFLLPFTVANCAIDLVNIRPKTDFPFPWSGKAFFDAMPESVLGIPAPVENPVFKYDHYDLVILAYQPWFLSPSIPATSMVSNESFQKIIANTPVITLIGARNMWITAQEKMKNLLKKCDAMLVGNLVFADRKPNLISAVTIQYWMFTGKKDRLLGIFPTPGVSETDVHKASEFGELALDALKTNQLNGLQDDLIRHRALEIKPIIMFVESRASVLFNIWAIQILKKKNRSLWISIFKYYLIIALFILSPLVIAIYMIFFRPFMGRKVKADKAYYSSVNYA